MEKQLFIRGIPAEKGMAVETFRGEPATLEGWREPHKPGSTGRVYIRMEGDDGTCEYYPSVIGGEWTEVVEDPAPVHRMENDSIISEVQTKDQHHTPECLDWMRQQETRQKEWADRWPHHCQGCHGWGGAHSSYDPSPAGVSLGSGSMVDFEPCPQCLENEAAPTCPRCGGDLSDHAAPIMEAEEACPYCGWEVENADGLPPGPECTCFWRF